MKKTVCVVLALLLALLCGCGGSKKAAPTRGEVTSEERQFAAPADGDHRRRVAADHHLRR